MIDIRYTFLHYNNSYKDELFCVFKTFLGELKTVKRFYSALPFVFFNLESERKVPKLIVEDENEKTSTLVDLSNDQQQNGGGTQIIKLQTFLWYKLQCTRSSFNPMSPFAQLVLYCFAQNVQEKRNCQKDIKLCRVCKLCFSISRLSMGCRCCSQTWLSSEV